MRLGHPMFETRTVHIVIPAYNAEKTIENALGSALAQRGVDVRILVVDHGSSDGTAALVSKYVTSGLVELVLIPHEATEKRSASQPLERGISHLIDCKHDITDAWLVRLDADDVLATDSSVKMLLDRAAGKQLVIGRIVFFDNDCRTAETYTVKPDCRSRQALLRGAVYSMPHHALLIRFNLLQRVRDRRGFAFDAQIGYGEDLDLTVELLKECEENQFSFVDLDFCYKRLDGATISRTSRKLSIALDHVHIFRRHGLICSELFARVLADLALQQLGTLDSPIRDWLGYPGKRWAEIHAVSCEAVWKWLAVLETMPKK